MTTIRSGGAAVPQAAERAEPRPQGREGQADLTLGAEFDRLLVCMPRGVPIGAQRLWVRVNDTWAEGWAKQHGHEFERISKERMKYLLGLLLVERRVRYSGGWIKC